MQKNKNLFIILELSNIDEPKSDNRNYLEKNFLNEKKSSKPKISTIFFFFFDKKDYIDFLVTGNFK